MQSSRLQRQVSDELVTGSGDLRDVQKTLMGADRERDVVGDDAADEDAELRHEPRPNPLWAVNGALAAFVFAAVMYLASR
jgi:hypothetical protein